jgi:RNA 3'-terminal phosphate cyclase (ATP)
MLTVDGGQGEGGGQIVRTTLSLATALGRPVRLVRIRARRPKPGLRPQHLTVVRALAAVGDARVAGDAVDSTELVFEPRGLRAGAYRFDVGTAGAVTLVLQALLLPLVRAAAPSHVTLVGGTHVPLAPVAPYVTEVFLPALAGLGLRAAVHLRRWGFVPAGGGVLEVDVVPGGPLDGLAAETPPEGPVVGLSAVARLPRTIAERQARRAEARLAAAGIPARIAVEEAPDAGGPGTVVLLAHPGRAGFSALGRRRLPAERVADAAVDALLAWRASGAALDVHLADQVLPFLALARGPSRFTCAAATPHLATVAAVVGALLPAGIAIEPGPPARVTVTPP